MGFAMKPARNVSLYALVEYALAGMDNDLFVSKYQLELPKKGEMQRFIEEQVRETLGERE